MFPDNFLQFLRRRYRFNILIKYEFNFPDISDTIIEQFNKSIKSKEKDSFKFNLNFSDDRVDILECIENIKELSKKKLEAEDFDFRDLPWFMDLIKLCFKNLNDGNYIPHSYFDLPVCVIYFSLSPSKYVFKLPGWVCDKELKIQVYNPVLTDGQNRDYILNELKPEDEGDSDIKNLINYEMLEDRLFKMFCDILSKINKQINNNCEGLKKYIEENHSGFGNSVMRMFGLGNKETKSLSVIRLKRLGDYFFCMFIYEEAMRYYVEVCNNFQEESDGFKSSCLFSLSMTSLMCNRGLNVGKCLEIGEKDRKLKLMSLFLVLCFTVPLELNNFISPTISQIEKHLEFIYFSKMIQAESNSNQNQTSSAEILLRSIILEIKSSISRPRHAAFYLKCAATLYDEVRFTHNCHLCLYKLYRILTQNRGWPLIKQFSLRNLYLINSPVLREVCAQLEEKQMINFDIIKEMLANSKPEKRINFATIKCLNIFVKSTGFPLSPRPEKLSLKMWHSFKKKLFPILLTKSVENIGPSAWQDDDIHHFNTAVGESIIVHVELACFNNNTNLLKDIKLAIDNTGIAESSVHSCEISSLMNIMFTITVKAEGSFKVTHIESIWEDCCPINISLPCEAFCFEALNDAPLVDLKVEYNDKKSYIGHPIHFKVLTDTLRGNLSTLKVITSDPFPVYKLNSDKQSNIWDLDTVSKSNEIVFEMVPTDIENSTITMHVFLSYSERNILRFSHACFDVEVEMFPTIKYTIMNNIINFSTTGNIIDISCPSLKFERKGNIIIVHDITNNLNSTNIDVSYEASGTTETKSLQLETPIVIFSSNTKNYSEIFPRLFCLELILLYSSDLTVEFVQPSHDIWCWHGKTSYIFKATSMYKEVITVNILTLNPINDNIGRYILLNGKNCLNRMFVVESNMS